MKRLWRVKITGANHRVTDVQITCFSGFFPLTLGSKLRAVGPDNHRHGGGGVFICPAQSGSQPDRRSGWTLDAIRAGSGMKSLALARRGSGSGGALCLGHDDVFAAIGVGRPGSVAMPVHCGTDIVAQPTGLGMVEGHVAIALCIDPRAVDQKVRKGQSHHDRTG